jgi:uncharacterized protein (TIGR02001 family)
VFRWAVAALLVLTAQAGFAQTAISAAVASDYRLRGVSLSQGRPVVQLDASYDFAQGAYAGAFFSNAMFEESTTIEMQMTGYGGYSLRLANGWSLDAGAAYTAFTGGEGYNYVEFHAGVATRNYSARIFYSPDYLELGVSTLYGELNGSYPLTERLRLIGHVGALQAVYGAANVGARHGPYIDGQIGVEYRWSPVSLQFSRVQTDSGAGIYPVGEEHLGGTWLARISVGF